MVRCTTHMLKAPTNIHRSWSRNDGPSVTCALPVRYCASTARYCAVPVRYCESIVRYCATTVHYAET